MLEPHERYTESLEQDRALLRDAVKKAQQFIDIIFVKGIPVRELQSREREELEQTLKNALKRTEYR